MGEYIIFNYLFFQVNSIGDFFKRLGIILLTIIIVPIYFIGVSVLIETYIKSVNKDYLLISTRVLDNIICILVPATIIIMIFSKIIIMIKTRDNFHRNNNKIFNSIYYFLLLSLIIVFINSLNNYTVLYKDKIVKHSVIKYFEKEYNYSDIESSDIGINWRNRKHPSFYYKIKFNDEYKVNLANGIFFGNYDIDNLVEVNDILIENKIIRNIDSVYFDIYTIDYNDDTKSSMERVFSE